MPALCRSVRASCRNSCVLKLALKWAWRRSIFMLCLAVVLWLTLTPGGGQAPLFPHIDKLQHFSAFFGLALLGRHAFPRHVLLMLLFLVFVGAAIEWAQLYVPQRTGTYGDWLADSLGAVLGVVFYPRALSLWQRWRNS